MNVIVFSKRAGSARQFELGRPMAMTVTIATLMLVLGGVLFAGIQLGRSGLVLNPAAQVTEWGTKLEQQRTEIAAARRDLEELRGLGRGRLRVGAFPTAVAALVPRAMAAFRSAHPQVNLSLVEGVTPRLLERLAADDADVAVVSTSSTSELDHDRFDLHHLLDERLLVAVARDHPLARRRTVRLADLAEDAFIVGSATAENTLLRASLPSGFRPRIDIVAAEWTGKLGCVAAGLGVALVPALAIRGTPPDIALIRLHKEDESVRQIYAATTRGRTPSPAVTRFLEYLRTSAAAL